MVNFGLCDRAGDCATATVTGRRADEVANAITFAIVILAIAGTAYLLTRG